MKLAHTCLRVINLEKSIKFYEKYIGLVVDRIKDYPDGNFTLAFLTDKERTYEIELTYNYNPDKPYDIGNGFSHIALYTNNLEESYEFHKNNNLKVSDIKSVSKKDNRYYFVTDPDGYLVEIIEKI